MPNLRESRTQQRMELQIVETIFDTTPRYPWQLLLRLLYEQIGERVPPSTVVDWRYGMGIKPHKPNRNGLYSRRDLVWLKGWGLWRRSYTGATFDHYLDWLEKIVEKAENKEDLSEHITEIEVVANECK